MKKMGCCNFKLLFTRKGKYGKNHENRGNCSVNNLTVNEEYMAAHRTKSYIEILDKVEAQIRRRSLDRLTSPSSSLPLHIHLSEQLLEPRQETLITMIEGSNLHPLLISYFQSSFEACNTCELLLQSVHQVRSNYKIIQRVIKLTKTITDQGSNTNVQFDTIFDELASFSMLNNPLLIIKPAQFSDIHSTHSNLLHGLTKKFRKIRRRAKLTRYCKRIGGYTVVFTCSALLAVLLIVAIHAMVGIFAAPGLIGCSFGLVRRNKLKSRGLKQSLIERLGEQLEIAAKGIFIMINDFDTMSRLVRRLQDEIEHIKDISDMCYKNRKIEVLMEVVREFQIHEVCVLEQLEELKEHIYLCFLNINRARMLVTQEIPQQD